jgi:hypothetical protein
MIEFKKKYSNSLRPGFTDEFHILEDAVKVFQEALQIKQATSVLLKKKVDLFGAVIGATFPNTATGKLSCHVYVHRHSTTLGTMICLAHELVHAWQIDTNQPKQPDWEDEAERLSLSMVEQYHIKRFPDKPESLCIGEVRLARVFVH